MDKFKKHINLERTFYSWYNYKNELPIDHKWITYLNLAFATNFENLNGGKQFNEKNENYSNFRINEYIMP